MTKPQLTIARSGTLPIGGWKAPCSVLNDGSRVISQRAFMELMEFKGRGNSIGHRMAHLLEHPNLNSKFFKELVMAIKQPIRFRTKNGVESFGYDGTLIVDYCKGLILARQSKVIEGEVAMRYVAAAESLLIAVAKTGIIALIDEATGYQETRERDALRMILDKFLRVEFAAWAKRFPDEFYREIFRLKGWEWQGMKMNRPSVVGHYTNDIVYSRLAPGILTELRSVNPTSSNGTRDHRHHQHLTDEIGHPALQQHIHTLLAFMRANTNWPAFMRLVDRSFPKIGETYMLALDDDEINA